MALPRTIHLPEVFDIRLERVAEASGETTESVLLDWVVHSMPELTVENIQDFSGRNEAFTTIRLWTLVEQSLEILKRVDREMKVLIDKDKQGYLTGSEQHELNDLSNHYHDLTLLRTKTLVELQERGYDVQSYLEKHAPKP